MFKKRVITQRVLYFYEENDDGKSFYLYIFSWIFFFFQFYKMIKYGANSHKVLKNCYELLRINYCDLYWSKCIGKWQTVNGYGIP